VLRVYNRKNEYGYLLCIQSCEKEKRLKREEFGIPLSGSEFKGRLDVCFNKADLDPILSCPKKLWENSSMKMLLDARNRVGAVDVEFNGRVFRVVVKSFRIRGINRVKSMVFPSKAQKAWCGSRILKKNNISTPFPIAFFEKRKGCAVRESYFLSEMVEGSQEIRALFKGSEGKDMEELLKGLAGFLSFVRNRGVLHRDLSDGNILVRRSRTEGYQFFLIDTNRVRKIKAFFVLRGLKSLIRLGIPFPYQRSFLELYLKPMPLKNWYWSWYRVNKVFFSTYIQLKKKLRIKKIAQKLKIQ
jgi:serine/threonine protein kinase